MHDYLDASQRKAVEALVELKQICDRHNIRFFLLAGSCLGAVRHKGMIPWDDDIDVGFLHDDWVKLKAILTSELGNGFSYIDQEIDPKYPRLFGKILFDNKPCVDLFLLSKWTTNNWKGLLHWRIRKFSVEGYKFSVKREKVVQRPGSSLYIRIKMRLVRIMRKIIFIILSPFVSSSWYLKIARKNEVCFEKLNSDYCYINLYSVYSRHKERLEKAWLEGTPSIVEFEGELYNTVSDTDAYLKHLYGDYMTPPPEKERKKIHETRFGREI